MWEYERDKINDFFRALAISMIYFCVALAILCIVYRHLPERFLKIKYIKLSFYILFGVVVLSTLNKFNNLKINYNIDSDRYYIQYNAPNYVETLTKNIVVYKSFKEEAEKKLEILKFFSPITLVVFLLSITITKNPEFDQQIPILGVNFTLLESIQYFGLSFIILYSCYLYKEFFYYKRCNRIISEYETSLLELQQKKEKNTSNI